MDRRNSSEDLKRRPSKRQVSTDAFTKRPARRAADTHNAHSRLDSDSDIRSYSKDSSYDLMSSSKRKKKKKVNVRLIITNIVLSIVLVFSSITFIGASILNSRMLKNNDIDAEESDNFKNVVVSPNENVVYFLVCGVDLSENLTDIIMVVCYDLANNNANVLQIPRDTYIGRDRDDTEKYYSTGKINEVYGKPYNGESKIKALMRCINDRLGLPIDHYATVTIKGTEKIIDIAGGVDITLERTLRLVDDTTDPQQKKTFEAGNVHFDGQWGTAFVRHRASYDQGDLGRQKAQRSFYAAFLKKILSLDFGQLTNIITQCAGDVSTDLTIGQMLGYAQKMKGMSLKDVSIMSVPGQSPSIAEARETVGLGYSYYSIHKEQYVKMINDYFRPYDETALTVDDISAPQVHTSYSVGYDDFLEGGDLSSFDSERKEETTSSENS